MALNCIARGDAIVKDNVFSERIGHATQLSRLGADVSTEGQFVRIRGKRQLRGGTASAADLRAAASLVLAGLVSHQPTVVHNVHHICADEHLPEKLARIGAQINFMDREVYQLIFQLATLLMRLDVDIKDYCPNGIQVESWGHPAYYWRSNRI